MQIIHSPDEILVKAANLRVGRMSIGLVPTMGALHEGHQALVRQSVADNNITITSIFVNPTQFNNPDDLAKYPQTFDSDVEKLKDWGCDVVFAPSEKEIYQGKPVIKLDFGNLEKVLEGKHRPGHFNGVGIIVSKLFNLTSPHRAYFGLKDFQQYLIIKKLVFDLSFPVDIIGIPTVRLQSGVAVSSRNQNLSDRGIKIASNIYRGLSMAQKHILENHSIDETIRLSRQFYEGVEGLDIEYLEIVDAESLIKADLTHKRALVICFAGYVEGVRLIDNLYLQPD